MKGKNNTFEICLINPPLDKKTTSKFPMSGIPLGIASLAAYLRKEKINAAVIDAVIEEYNIKETAEVAIKTGAKIIGISCLTENRYAALKTLKEAKRINPKIIAIIGGLHATFTDEIILKNYPFVDLVVRGEGEETLLELIKKIKNKKPLEKILGITYRKKGKIIANPSRPFMPSIEDLPFPAYDLFPMKKYTLPPDIKGKVNQTSLITTSRGCPMGCKFCETTHAWGKKIRNTSAKKLFETVKYLYENFGIDYIRFADDLFTMKREKVIEFCELLIKSKLPIRFRIQARVDTVDLEELKLLEKAGCDLIEYGAESGSNKVLKEVGKNITIDRIKNAVNITREAKIDLKYFLIVGSLKEGPNETWETFKLIKETHPDWIGINALTIYPGTGVYDIAKEEKIINEDLWINYINPKTGNAPLYTKNYNSREMIFLAQLGHVWACRNSPKRKDYPKFEKILASILTENFAKLLVKNKIMRKTAANLAWVFSPLLP
ncbi:MAG TPA: radical SAM protein [Candidatus Pacearchaeota archaeon]|nr:coproporphyrinogen III oxidase [archaeon BMS3Abin17]HDK42691.1 radical SAM protein [Candidatus Pacearchaeota archaeon]HDZ60966.1 radical SAM protein [Candidatus Pacearchaeota archaeon]